MVQVPTLATGVYLSTLLVGVIIKDPVSELPTMNVAVYPKSEEFEFIVLTMLRILLKKSLLVISIRSATT